MLTLPVPRQLACSEQGKPMLLRPLKSPRSEQQIQRQAWVGVFPGETMVITFILNSKDRFLSLLFWIWDALVAQQRWNKTLLDDESGL